MNKKIIASFLTILILSMGSFVCAQDGGDGGEKAGHKLEKGVIQLGTSIIDIPKAIYNESTSRGNPISGVPIGILKGVGNAVANIFSGVFNIITCPFPRPEMDAVMFPPAPPQQPVVK